jgi:hypothetical protein
LRKRIDAKEVNFGFENVKSAGAGIKSGSEEVKSADEFVKSASENVKSGDEPVIARQREGEQVLQEPQHVKTKRQIR